MDVVATRSSLTGQFTASRTRRTAPLAPPAPPPPSPAAAAAAAAAAAEREVRSHTGGHYRGWTG